MNVQELVKDYNWEEAFGFCSFSNDAIDLIITTDEGWNDGDPWLAVGTLKSGEYFFLTAWCDYTGWDCRSGGHSEQAPTLEHLIRFCMGDEDRQRLGYTLPPETAGAPLPLVGEG